MSNWKTKQIAASDSPSIDAFGRLRVSEAFTLFDSKKLYDKQLLYYSEATSGAGSALAHNANESSVTMTVGAGANAYAIRQTKQYFNYQPGKSQLGVFTFNFNSGVSHIYKRVGYFDDNNGVFLQLYGTTLSVVIRTNTSGSPSDTATYNQADWNIDKLNGAGAALGNPSGISLDMSKAQIFFMDLEWLGVGRVRFGFVIGGVHYYCHQALHTNSNTIVYMKSANLPVRYEIRNDASGSAGSTMAEICSAIMCEGGFNPKGLVFGVDNAATGVSITTSLLNLISVRLQAGRESTTIIPLTINAMVTTAINYRWALVLNPTLGGVPAFNPISNSSMSWDVAATSVANGTVLASGYVSSVVRDFTYNLDFNIPFGVSLTGTADILTLAIQTASGTGTFFGSITWREIT